MEVIMKIKKVLAIVLTVAMLVTCLAFFGGCKDDNTTDEKVLRVAVVTSPSGVDDGNFNYDVYQGIVNFEKQKATYGYDRVEYKNVNITNMDWETALKPGIEAIVTEYDVIILSGFQFGTMGLKTIAEANPDVSFMLIDSFINNDEFEAQKVANVYAVQFMEQESGFLAGMAAALESTSKKVAVVNGIAYPSNVNYQWGFYSGVNYVNSQNKDVAGWTPVEVIELATYADKDYKGNYLGTFTDAATGKTCGEALIAAGCDVIFVAAGGAGNGVFTAAKEAAGNVKVIGCDANEYSSGYKSGSAGANVVLTSALKVLNKAVFDALVDYSKNEFKGNTNATLGATGDYTGYVKAEGSHQLKATTITAIDTAYAAIKAGTIVPAANFNGVNFGSFAVGVAQTPARAAE
jgi:Uncharacterized ABC-type transport system, periplasmic component/surface lipoprotein